MELRETETSYVFEVKLNEKDFSLTLPKPVTWQEAHQVSHAMYEEIVRLSYRAALDEQAKKAAEEAEVKPEEVAAEVVN